MHITPKFVYDSYPDSDLLNISDVTPRTQLKEMNLEHCGDTLFAFLCKELCSKQDNISPEEGVRRCESAIRQIEAVRDALAAADHVQEKSSAI